jgi:hypothetical protein
MTANDTVASVAGEHWLRSWLALLVSCAVRHQLQPGSRCYLKCLQQGWW